MENQEVMDLVIKAMLALVPIVVTILSYYLKGVIVVLQEKVKAEIGNEQYATMITFAGIFVRAVEQTMGMAGGEAKKDAVIGLLVSLAEENGIAISEEQIEAIVEGIYNEIKEELK